MSVSVLIMEARSMLRWGQNRILLSMCCHFSGKHLLCSKHLGDRTHICHLYLVEQGVRLHHPYWPVSELSICSCPGHKLRGPGFLYPISSRVGPVFRGFCLLVVVLNTYCVTLSKGKAPIRYNLRKYFFPLVILVGSYLAVKFPST